MLLSFLKRFLPKRRAKGFLKNQTGVAALEFAILGPIFGVILFVMFETGLMLYTEYTIQASVQEAARLVRTGQVQMLKADGKKWDAASFKKAICFIAGRISNCEDRLTVYMQTETSFQALQANTPAYLSIGPGTYTPNADGTPRAPFSCGGPKEVVALIATYDWDIHVPFMKTAFSNLPGNEKRRMVGFAMFRNEPYPAVAAAQACQAS
jgi:Flp pilus assembly protein TadG